ncbi:molybdenum cofactor biosynthesis protein MoaE [Xanthomonas arboricola]|uniref:Molybdopterin synthase catalytic subunit n=4 Tax=Xanthomonas arboricola pv. pruni TaxID=69929 RepID=A0AAP4K8C0_9XANT|nr:molybdenum cofactor biosynthesis protein MoaE [Xanthomonas arboricola]KCW98581.1 molybdopterin-converting factor chain 2 [Xanthomonas arboricola pv. pruni]KPN11837.1 molybdopterin-converting factor chain 2 [Xanthomonas arboricola pv. pruni]MDN0265786.1 molybdenum cofactor biosynthesis protein MoaE [Xanthomonas arboricola pv. pruni]MDN0269710.1 molybdenum cofactor biosynthesis protein MoaE [Xanthomonas arboricola pv. pruni]MDN0275710.1 molybdenum cofactor biosynthesis protein MoaE [Xanthomon
MSMSEQTSALFALSDVPLPVDSLRAALEHPHAGAFASFEGWVRNHNEGRSVVGLRYEAYAALAQAEGQRVLDEAMSRFAIVNAYCVHRVGELRTGDMAVWVGVSAAHRGAAFDACRFIIDEVKARVPIWKHEHYLEGDAGWLHPESQTQ